MREPSSFKQLYAWHTKATSGEKPDVFIDEPQCGFFKTRLVKGGPWVAAKIFIERDLVRIENCVELASDERFACEIDSERHDPYDQWPWLCKNPITKTQYDVLKTQNGSDKIMRATRAPIDIANHFPTPRYF